MKVKGVAFLGRKSVFVAQFGEGKWEEAVRAFRLTEPTLPSPVLPSTLIDLDVFLRFNDGLVDRYYGGDRRAYWQFGEGSAEWAFTEGPYKTFLASRDFHTYVAMAQALYRNYFPEGEARGSIDGDVVTLRIYDVPMKEPHPYLEYSVCGFFKRGLEMVGGRVLETRVLRGFTKGDTEVHYEFLVAA